MPGVTAALAAGAAFGQSLTERGFSDTLVLATGMSREGDAPPDSVRLTGPGTITCFYMSARQAGRLQSDLLAKGLGPGTIVRVDIDLSKPGQRLTSCRLDHLETHMREAGCGGCAILMVTWPRAASAQVEPRLAEAVCA